MSKNPRKRLGELVKEAEEENITNKHEKALPYLGWFWRSVDGDYTAISWHNGKLWLNEARKWGYPGVRISNKVEDDGDYVLPDDLEERELDKMCEELCRVLERAIETGALLQGHKEEFQHILYERSGNIPVTWYRCDYCGDEFSRAISFNDSNDVKTHVKDNHPDEFEGQPSYGDWERFTHHHIDADPSSDTRGDYIEVEDE